MRRIFLSLPRFDRALTVYASHPLVRVFGMKQSCRIPILMYHSISDNLFGISHPYYQINTSPEAFHRQMRWLRKEGYETVDLARAWESLDQGTDLSKKVVLTFDDGYRDFYIEALPILKQYGFVATVFLATDRIRNHSARIEGAEYLTWNDVRELQTVGIRFGSHTVSHADLRSLDLEQIEFELQYSKETIEQQTGAIVESFSYPFSFPEEDRSFTRFLEDVLLNLGFTYGVSTILGCAQRNKIGFFLPRLPVNSWDDKLLLRAKIEGGYDWMHWPQFLKKFLLHNGTLPQRDVKNKVIAA